MTAKVRLDQWLVTHGLVQSRERAKALIMAGVVLVDDAVASKPGLTVRDGAEVRLKKGADDDWASRGAHKLLPALQLFGVDPTDKVCLDVGASTGGFTDVLLRGGAGRVYAVDVGYGQLIWRLQSHEKVIVVDRTNARYLTDEHVPELVELVVIDVSFISLTLILPAVRRRCKPGAHVLAMVKPQFEVGKGRLGKGGVVRDDNLRREAIDTVANVAASVGFIEEGRRDNDVLGPKGNRECFLYLIASDGSSIQPEVLQS